MLRKNSNRFFEGSGGICFKKTSRARMRPSFCVCSVVLISEHSGLSVCQPLSEYVRVYGNPCEFDAIDTVGGSDSHSGLGRIIIAVVAVFI